MSNPAPVDVPRFETFAKYEGWILTSITESMAGDPQGFGLPTFSQGLSGEAGEVLELLEYELESLMRAQRMGGSVPRFGHAARVKKFELEAGDVLWYLVAICALTGTNLQRVANPARDFETFDEYQGWATEDQDRPSDGLNESCSEALSRIMVGVRMVRRATGVTDQLKKHLGHKHPLDQLALEHGISGTLRSLAGLCVMFGTTLQTCAERNHAKLIARYSKSGKLTTEESINRSPEVLQYADGRARGGLVIAPPARAIGSKDTPS